MNTKALYQWNMMILKLIYIYIYINFGIEFNIKKSKFKVSNHVRISKYKNSFVNGYQLSQIDEKFVI